MFRVVKVLAKNTCECLFHLKLTFILTRITLKILIFRNIYKLNITYSRKVPFYYVTSKSLCLEIQKEIIPQRTVQKKNNLHLEPNALNSFHLTQQP